MKDTPVTLESLQKENKELKEKLDALHVKLSEMESSIVAHLDRLQQTLEGDVVTMKPTVSFAKIDYDTATAFVSQYLQNGKYIQSPSGKLDAATFHAAVGQLGKIQNPPVLLNPQKTTAIMVQLGFPRKPGTGNRNYYEGIMEAPVAH